MHVCVCGRFDKNTAHIKEIVRAREQKIERASEQAIDQEKARVRQGEIKTK